MDVPPSTTLDYGGKGDIQKFQKLDVSAFVRYVVLSKHILWEGVPTWSLDLLVVLLQALFTIHQRRLWRRKRHFEQSCFLLTAHGGVFERPGPLVSNTYIGVKLVGNRGRWNTHLLSSIN